MKNACTYVRWLMLLRFNVLAEHVDHDIDTHAAFFSV
jgi:hypothetical protein